MSPKVAVSKRAMKRSGTDRGASSSRPSTSRPSRRSARVRFAVESEGNPTPSSQPSMGGSESMPTEEVGMDSGGQGIKMFDLSSLPEKVGGKKVPKAKFRPRDLPEYYFGLTEGRKYQFYTTMLGRPVHIPRKIDLKYLDECKSDIRSMINFQGWSELLDYDAPLYNELCLIFYFNWNPREHSSYVKGKEIRFGGLFGEYEKKLGEILGVPYYDDDVDLSGEEIFNSLSSEKEYTRAHKFMKIMDLNIEMRMLRKILESMIIPKLGGTENVTEYEALVLYKLYNYKRISLPKLLFNAFGYMPQRTDHVVPYGVWLTKVFQHFEIDVSGESALYMSTQKKDWVGDTLLRRMQIRHEDYVAENNARHEEEMEDEEGSEDGDDAAEEPERPTEDRMDTSSSSQAQPSRPPSTSQPTGRPSSAYHQLAVEVESLRREVGEIRATQVQMQVQLGLLLDHFGICPPTPAPTPTPPPPPPTAEPSSSPIPAAAPTSDVHPSAVDTEQPANTEHDLVVSMDELLQTTDPAAQQEDNASTAPQP